MNTSALFRHIHPRLLSAILAALSLGLGATWTVAAGYALQFTNSTVQQVAVQPVPELNLYPFTVTAWIKAGAQPADLEYYGRVSLDNGLTWGVDAPISDAPFRRPNQGDPLILGNYFGTYTFSGFSDDGYGDTAYRAWVDGRVVLNDTYVQSDVFFDQITFGSELRIASITKAPNGDLILLGTGGANRAHSLQTATNLALDGFTHFATVTPNSYGMWKHNSGPIVSGQRFFRLAWP